MHWDTSLRPQNVGSERLRKSVLRDVLVQTPTLNAIRRRLSPNLLTEHVKSLWRVKDGRTDLSPDLRKRRSERFDPDLKRLGSWLGVDLDCETFSEKTENRSYEWIALSGGEREPTSRPNGAAENPSLHCLGAPTSSQRRTPTRGRPFDLLTRDFHGLACVLPRREPRRRPETQGNTEVAALFPMTP